MRRWRWIAVFIGLIGMVSWGFAQDDLPVATVAVTEEAEVLPTATLTLTPTSRFSTPTLTPTPQIEGFIIYGESEVIFPQAIRFLLHLDAALIELEAATLTLRPEGEPPVEIAVDFEEDVLIDQPDTDFEIIWSLPVDDPLPLFTSIEYEWVVQAQSGETARLVDQVYLIDQRVTWTRVEDSSISLALPLRKSEAQRLLILLNPVYDLLAANTGREPTYRLLLYDEETPPGCTIDAETDEPIAVGAQSGLTLPCELTNALAMYSASGYTVLRQPGGVNPAAFLTEYMMRDFYAPLWRNADVPSWFAAGLAQLYTPTRTVDLLTPALVAARGAGVLTLPVMSGPPPGSPSAAALWRAQSYGMVLYIAETAGLEKVYELAAALDGGERFQAAYERIVGEPLDRLIPAWSNWLFSRDAPRVYALNLYGPATAVPTPSPTLTASRTPSRTPSLTPSLTPSVTGFLSPTPSATPLPSLTFTPLPPSVTPRRPGSLPTLTPTPAPTLVDTLAEPTVQGGVLAGLAVILAVLVFVFIRLGRR